MQLTKVRLIYIGTVLLFILALVVGLFSLRDSDSHDILGILTPLGDVDTRLNDQLKQVEQKKSLENLPLDNYFPKNTKPTFELDFEINAKAYAVMERGSGELLLAKNLTKELPIASVTKIMTALVAIDHSDLDIELTVDLAAAKIGEATMGLSAGELVSVEKLLYGLMLPSGNDAAETLAQGLQGGRTNFLFMMNQKAQSLGMFDTFYVNPSGLDGKTLAETSYSTVFDQLALTNYALTKDKFAQIVSTYYKEFPYEEGKHKAFYLYNILQLDRSYPGIKGVKPGTTDFAQETLVSYAERDGKQVIVVLLGTQNSRDEVVKVYDWVFAKLGVQGN